MFTIIKYSSEYKEKLMNLIHSEGDDWKIYWNEPNATRYSNFFDESIIYLAVSNGTVCGYIRAIKDSLFIYVCDLLVNKDYRGNDIGNALMKQVQIDYENYGIYIMSGNDEYYEKTNCKKEGSIFLYNPSK